MKFIKPLLSSIIMVLLTMPAFSHQMTHQASRVSDEQIIGIMMAVDNSEIAAANIAQSKKTGVKVKHYADYLKKQHQHNLIMLKKLEQETGLKATESTQSVAIAKGAQKDGKALNKLNGQAFDTAYINAMVAGHSEGLKLINTVLLKDATNAKVKKCVKSFRAMVERHLKKGKGIQAGM